MTQTVYHFDDFTLNLAQRQLRRGERVLDINARYLDALALLVQESGGLVSKERFLAEVWQGIPVTDEALTQCIKTLRKALGDVAGSPRFIETVPKHGYRFIASVQTQPTPMAAPVPGGQGAASPPPRVLPAATLIPLAAGILGGALAGVLGGLAYGFVAASQSQEAGALSVLVVMLCLSLLVAVPGAAGVVGGFVLARRLAPAARGWPLFGAACGGLLVGALGKLIGVDTLHLLFGQAPGDITGAFEGLLIGLAVGAAILVVERAPGQSSLSRSVALAALLCAAVGLLLAVLGRPLLGGSLELLARSFPSSRLQLDALGALFGEQDFGPRSQLLAAAVEAGLFGSCIASAMQLARRAAANA
jgi:DNA-binding winged helix-turn-helix (wHTH) protein